MNLSRRSFFGGALSLTVVAGARPQKLLLADGPTMSVERIENDHPRQALRDGKPFRVAVGGAMIHLALKGKRLALRGKTLILEKV